MSDSNSLPGKEEDRPSPFLQGVVWDYEHG